MRTTKLSRKLMLFLCGWIILTTNSCDIYRAFQENKEIEAFLNQKLTLWIKDEHIIFEKYNQLIEGENFDTQVLWESLDQFLIPSALLLRETIALEEIKKERLVVIQQLFIRKLDTILEGFSLILDGLKKKDNKSEEESMQMVYKGRDKLKEVSHYNHLIELEVKKMQEEYYIKSDKEENLTKEKQNAN